MINAGLKQDIDDYKKKTSATDHELEEKIKILTVNFEKSLKIINLLSDKIETLENNLTSTSDALRILREGKSQGSEKNSIEPVHFHYELIHHQPPIGILKFGLKISSSSDNSYDLETGRFTVPRNGTFVFILIFHGTKDHTGVEIMIDGKTKSRAYMAEKDNNGATSVTAKLSKGQVVEAKLTQGTIYGYYSVSSFQGFQI